MLFWKKSKRQSTGASAGPIDLSRSKIPFDAILVSLGLGRQSTALDIGAGGFVGASTTRYLVDRLQNPIVGLELDPARCEALKEKFGATLEVNNGDIRTFDFGGRTFDIVVADVDCFLIPEVFNNWLPNRLHGLLKPGGFAVLVNFDHIKDPIDASAGISAEVQEGVLPFLIEKFGDRHVTGDNVRKAYAADPLFEGIDAVGKWNGRENVLNWVILRKRSS
jgi:hypothetical protein